MNFNPTWISLKILGGSPIVRSSFWWTVITPLAAKVVDSLPDEIPLTFLGPRVTVSLDLPFSWTWFFFGALAFSVATFLYDKCCPKLVSAYDNFHGYRSTGGGVIEIYHSLRESKEIFYHNKLLTNDLFASYRISAKSSGMLDVPPRLMEITSESNKSEAEIVDAVFGAINSTMVDCKPSECADLFAVTLRAENMRKPSLRKATAITYLVGFVCFGWVILQNIIYVLSRIAG